jgi:hypothetical protein
VRHAGRDEARDVVGGAAGGLRDDKAQRPIGKIGRCPLGEKRRREEER